MFIFDCAPTRYIPSGRTGFRSVRQEFKLWLILWDPAEWQSRRSVQQPKQTGMGFA